METRTESIETEEIERRIKRFVDDRIVEATRKLYDNINPRIEELKKKLANQNRMAIIASKGSLDMAYPPLILATTARSMGLESGIFFTFFGLDIINRKKNKSLKVSAVGNPAMPVPMPTLLGVLPGMEAMGTMMMNSWMSKQSVPSVPQLLEMAQESGVRLVACQMTMDVMGTKAEDLIPGLDFGGVATFLEFAEGAGITLFV